MRGIVAYARSSPCPTLVLDRTGLPRDQGALSSALRSIRTEMVRAGRSDVLKVALISPSANPWFDLEYSFVQWFRGDDLRLDARGTCGHSLIAAVAVVPAFGWLPSLTRGAKVRVHASNTDDSLVCELEAWSDEVVDCTLHFLGGVRLADTLISGEAITSLRALGTSYRTSIVSVANPYVFVDAASAGLMSRETFFIEDDALLRALLAVQREAQDRLGFEPGSAFPKVALVGQFAPETVAVRALTVPSWHPAFALTGTICLGAAASIPGTVVSDLAHRAGCARGLLRAESPGAVTEVRTTVSRPSADGRLEWCSVPHKHAHRVGTVALPDFDVSSSPLLAA